MKKQIDLVGLFVSAAELMFMNEGRFYECEGVSGEVVKWMLIVGLQDQDGRTRAEISHDIFFYFEIEKLWAMC